MAKVNDIVRFLNATGGGRISRIEAGIAYVEDADGFEQPVLLRECVVVDESKPKATAYDRPLVPPKSKEQKPATAPKPAASDMPVIRQPTRFPSCISVSRQNCIHTATSVRMRLIYLVFPVGRSCAVLNCCWV